MNTNLTASAEHTSSTVIGRCHDVNSLDCNLVDDSHANNDQLCIFVSMYDRLRTIIFPIAMKDIIREMIT